MKRIPRNYEDESNRFNDLTNLIYQLAVFCTIDNKIYKLVVLDQRGMRFEVAGDRIGRWVRFQDGILFNFTIQTELEHYYDFYANAYTKPRTKEFIYEMLATSINRVGLIKGLDPADDPELKGKKDETES